MITLEQFKANAQSHGICGMLDDWNRAKSKRQLMDVALSIRGIEYLASAIAQGWGISPDAIERDFHMFINGGYTRDKDGYTSEMYCRPPEDRIEITAAATLVIGFKGTLAMRRPAAEIYLCGSDVAVEGEGARLHLYNSAAEGGETITEDDKHGS